MNDTEVFSIVIAEKDQVKRLDLINELCKSDKALKTRVQKLLAAHDDPEPFFNDPAQLVAEREIDQTDDWKQFGSAKIGSNIGPYKLLQQIGEGGMGLVFMAEQTEPVKRRVALKIIKPGMDSRQVIARFEAERQALALMDHPNIAKVLDAGTTCSGHPYFVMELVNGAPISDYCDQEKMTTAGRLKLFIDICRAAQHAHQKGIIHRDLKPNNILVAEYDGNPVPKIIDFGVAKATGFQLTDKTVFTEFGQIIGTLEYMSPEQARRNQLDIDTRSDIYSLGMVLYKLLTGETPFGQERFQRAAWDEAMKIIREEEPPLPSVKIGSSQTLDQIAIRRSVEPSRLTALIRGDLDWIVLKTLAKDRNRRYPSAGELADDVNRHLSQHSVSARPPSTIDRLAKFIRRNRGSVTAAALLAIASFVLVGWLSSTAIKYRNEIAARTQRVEQAISRASVSMVKAEVASIGDEASWELASAQIQRIEEILDQGGVHADAKIRAQEMLANFEFKQNEREIAVQIEEVVIQGATNPDITSWQKMEFQMRDFFRQHGFNLDKDDAADIGRRIRDHPSSELWADLLELWIATRGQMSSLGGPKLTAAIMQPWADAIYVADEDPVRTGIRKFVYVPPHKKDTLDRLTQDLDLTSLSPRTLSWLGTCYGMVQAFEESDQIYATALMLYPRDLMLAHDYGYGLYHQQRYQESVRMYHRCLAIRNDVAGIWKSLSLALEKLGEDQAAKRAMETSQKLANNQRNEKVLEGAK